MCNIGDPISSVECSWKIKIRSCFSGLNDEPTVRLGDESSNQQVSGVPTCVNFPQNISAVSKSNTFCSRNVLLRKNKSVSSREIHPPKNNSRELSSKNTDVSSREVLFTKNKCFDPRENKGISSLEVIPKKKKSIALKGTISAKHNVDIFMKKDCVLPHSLDVVPTEEVSQHVTCKCRMCRLQQPKSDKAKEELKRIEDIFARSGRFVSNEKHIDFQKFEGAGIDPYASNEVFTEQDCEADDAENVSDSLEKDFKKLDVYGPNVEPKLVKYVPLSEFRVTNPTASKAVEKMKKKELRKLKKSCPKSEKFGFKGGNKYPIQFHVS